MNVRGSLVVTSIACVLALGAGSLAWQPEERPARQQGQPGQPGERGPGRGPGGQQVNVEGAMKGMNRALRQLGQQIGDTTKRSENLRLINEMQRGCVNAKGGTLPEKYFAEAKDDAAKAKVSEEFRHEMVKVLRLLIDIEEAIAGGKTDEAAAKLKELGAMRDHGHEEFGVE